MGGREAALALEDGTLFVGQPFGARRQVGAEVVFNTSMTGYQEVASDPSYRGQMVVMTHPQIGNYGVAPASAESSRPWVSALIVRDLARRPHHWESSGSLDDHLAEAGVPGLEGVDTRSLVRRLRGSGTQRGLLGQSGPGGFTRAELSALVRDARGVTLQTQGESVAEVSGAVPVAAGDDRIVVLDLGIKRSIVRSIERRGLRPTIVPWSARATTILALRPRAIVLSNGPGDPAALGDVVSEVREIIRSGIPVFGICLGHQLIGLAAGASTSRLRFGHHGGNHPVQDLRSGRVTITTQNHEFQIDRGSLTAASGFDVSHVDLNDGSVEGLRHRELPVWSLQYHPEGSPGPRDDEGAFDELLAVAGIRTREATLSV